MLLGKLRAVTLVTFHHAHTELDMIQVKHVMVASGSCDLSELQPHGGTGLQIHPRDIRGTGHETGWWLKNLEMHTGQGETMMGPGRRQAVGS